MPNRQTAAPTTPIDLALLGGGSHGAFTWGVLEALLEDGRLAFDGVSGTSAGAMNAAVLACGYERGLAVSHGDANAARGEARKALRDFWSEHGAQLVLDARGVRTVVRPLRPARERPLRSGAAGPVVPGDLRRQRRLVDPRHAPGPAGFLRTGGARRGRSAGPVPGGGRREVRTGHARTRAPPEPELGQYAQPKLISGILRSSVFRSLRAHVADHFQSPRLRQLMEFPVLFLGATPARTPALYILMNYADMALGTWYPMGGMGRIVEGMVRVAEAQGARFLYDHPVQQVLVRNGRAGGVRTAHSELFADVVVAGADYHHVDQHLLAEELRAYSPSYWDSQLSALLHK